MLAWLHGSKCDIWRSAGRWLERVIRCYWRNLHARLKGMNSTMKLIQRPPILDCSTFEASTIEVMETFAVLALSACAAPSSSPNSVWSLSQSLLSDCIESKQALVHSHEYHLGYSILDPCTLFNWRGYRIRFCGFVGSARNTRAPSNSGEVSHAKTRASHQWVSGEYKSLS